MIYGSKTNNNVPLLYSTPYIGQNMFLNTDIVALGFSLPWDFSIRNRWVLDLKIYVLDRYINVESWVSNPRRDSRQSMWY